ncbi:MAG: hypothetical protein HY875_12600 [Chloroflexi bacterium]|nr:hypothetical protein [Chloroflexota bacterium]
MWSATRHRRGFLGVAVVAVLLVGSGCGGSGGGEDGGGSPAPYPTPYNLGFGAPIYPGAEYDPPPAGEITAHIVVIGGRSYDRESHDFSVDEPWATVAAWYRDTFDDPGIETEQGTLRGRDATWTVDESDTGWTEVKVSEARPTRTVITVYRNTYTPPK